MTEVLRGTLVAYKKSMHEWAGSYSSILISMNWDRRWDELGRTLCVWPRPCADSTEGQSLFLEFIVLFFWRAVRSRNKFECRLAKLECLGSAISRHQTAGSRRSLLSFSSVRSVPTDANNRTNQVSIRVTTRPSALYLGGTGARLIQKIWGPISTPLSNENQY